MNRVFIRLLLLCMLGAALNPAFAEDADARQLKSHHGQPWRILHVMSYESNFNWSDDQLSGFKLGFGSDARVEYKIVQLDAKRNDSPQSIAEHAQQAERLISEWKPDLLYVSDDAAVEAMILRHSNTGLPCVFSGMNRSMEHYGLVGAKNVTGVLEQEHFVETVRLLQQLKPGTSRIHLISDQAAYWIESIQRIERLARTTGGLSLVGVDRIERYADFQRLILQNPKQADAYLLLGTFNYKDEHGSDVPFKELHQWVAENSKIPDVSFWLDRIKHGTLAGVAVSALEQGRKAGLAARLILLEGRSPGSIPVEATRKGVASINLARARALGITPRSGVLLTSVVSTNYEWATR